MFDNTSPEVDLELFLFGENYCINKLTLKTLADLEPLMEDGNAARGSEMNLCDQRSRDLVFLSFCHGGIAGKS